MNARFVNLRAVLRVNRAALEEGAAYQNATVSMRAPASRENYGWLLHSIRAVDRSHRRCVPWPLLLSAVLSACAWMGASGPKASATARIEPRDTRLVHEDCPLAGTAATAEDINGDG